MDNLNSQSKRVQSLLERIKFNLFDKFFLLFWELDKKTAGRIYIQVTYLDKCRQTGKECAWYGRKWYLSDHMTDDEIVKTAYAACKAVVEHEIMEAFTVDGKVLFNPHVDFETLLSISDKEIRRDPIGKLYKICCRDNGDITVVQTNIQEKEVDGLVESLNTLSMNRELYYKMEM